MDNECIGTEFFFFQNSFIVKFGTTADLSHNNAKYEW